MSGFSYKLKWQMELVAKEGSAAKYRYIVLKGACVATKDPETVDANAFIPWAWLRHQIVLAIHSMQCFQEAPPDLSI